MTTDVIAWRGLRLERHADYPRRRYSYLAMGGACWIVEELEVSGWIAWVLLGDVTRFMSPGTDPTEALEGIYADALRLEGRLRQTLGEMVPDDREQ